VAGAARRDALLDAVAEDGAGGSCVAWAGPLGPGPCERPPDTAAGERVPPVPLPAAAARAKPGRGPRAALVFAVPPLRGVLAPLGAAAVGCAPAPAVPLLGVAVDVTDPPDGEVAGRELDLPELICTRGVFSAGAGLDPTSARGEGMDGVGTGGVLVEGTSIDLEGLVGAMVVFGGDRTGWVTEPTVEAAFSTIGVALSTVPVTIDDGCVGAARVTVGCTSACAVPASAPIGSAAPAGVAAPQHAAHASATGIAHRRGPGSNVCPERV
jgi:hypothetical protein